MPDERALKIVELNASKKEVDPSNFALDTQDQPALENSHGGICRQPCVTRHRAD